MKAILTILDPTFYEQVTEYIIETITKNQNNDEAPHYHKCGNCLMHKLLEYWREAKHHDILDVPEHLELMKCTISSHEALPDGEGYVVHMQGKAVNLNEIDELVHVFLDEEEKEDCFKEVAPGVQVFTGSLEDFFKGMTSKVKRKRNGKK
jgi:hypothetical protein